MTANRLFEAIMDTTHALIVVLDAEGRIVLFNKACERLSGYCFEEVQGRLVRDFLLLPEEAAGVKATIENLHAGQFPDQYKNHWVSKSGEFRLIEWSNSAVTDESGRVIQIIATGIDVTERECTEQALREKQQQQRLLLDSIPDAAWLKDAEGRYTEVNQNFMDILLDDASDPIGKTGFDIHPAALASARAKENAELMRTRQPLRLERTRVIHGKEVHLDIIKVPLIDAAGKVAGIAGLARDVTPHKLAEQQLRVAQQQQKALLDSFPDAAWLKDAEGRFIAANRKFYDLLEDPETDPIGKTAFDIFPGEWGKLFAEEDRKVFESGQPMELIRHRVIHGKPQTRKVFRYPVLDDSGKVVGVAGVSRDITESHRAENLLHLALQRQKALLDSIPDAAWLKDNAGRYVEVNQNWCARHNLERAEIIGKIDQEIFPEQNNQEVILEDLQIIKNRQPFHIERPQYRSVATGDERWLEIAKTPVLDEHGTVIGIAGVSRDITERKLAEHTRLKRDTGLRAALVREVNHRIKNNLQSVMALLHQHAVSHPETALVIQKAIARLNAIAIVHGMHSGAADQEVNLCNIVNALATSMWGLHSGAPIEVQTSDDFVAVQVTNSETVPVALIINELIQNAVKHSPAADSGKPIRIQLTRSGPAIRISITNPGAVLPASFDYALGTGLGTGLNLLKSLMPQTGAEISFETAAPAGVTVTLTLAPPVLMETDKPQSSSEATRYG